MRRNEKQITDNILIEEIIKSSNICRIAMVDNGKPYLIPMNFGYENGIIYFHTALKGRKLDVLEKNSYVCFEIEADHKLITGKKACDWTSKFRSVIGYGNIEFETVPEEKIKALDIIMKAHGSQGENIFNLKVVEKTLILKLKIESISGKQSGDW